MKAVSLNGAAHELREFAARLVRGAISFRLQRVQRESKCQRRNGREAGIACCVFAAHLAAPRIERREMEIPASPTPIGYSASWAAIARPLVV
jgi:hypothetical protein